MTVEFTFIDDRAIKERRWIAEDLSGDHLHVYHFVDFQGEDDYDLPEDAPAEAQRNASHARRRVADPAEANVFSSLLAGQEGVEDPLHTVAIDLDHRARLVPSSTEDHGHLYIDKVMPWSDYLKLLRVMAEVGLVEPGYVSASERRLATHLRMPWEAKKEQSA